MAMLASEVRYARFPRKFDRAKNSSRSVGQRNQAVASIYFPYDALGMTTRFRKRVLQYIYRSALALSEGRLESAAVSVSSQPDEEDSLTLDLTLTIDSDWENIKKLRREILVKIGEWSREWTEDEKDDYGRRIYFGLIPSSL